MNHHPTGYLRAERLSQAQTEAMVAEALERVREAIGMAKRTVKLAVEMAASATNDELGYVPNSQERAKAQITPDDCAATIQTLEQYMDDLFHLPLSLMSREANEE